MKKIIIITVLFFCAAVSTLCAQTINVLTQKAETSNIRKLLQFTGETKPYVESYVSVDVTGPIAQITVENGDRVQKGQVLAKVDDTRFILAMRQAEAALDIAKQQFKEVESDYKRNETLFQKKAITQKTLDSALTSYITSKTGVKQAQISYDSAKLDVERCSIRALIDGYFADRDMELGQALTKGQVVGKVVNLDAVAVEARIAEGDIKNVEIGQKCLIDGSIDGIIEHINMYADGSRAFKVRIKAENPKLTYLANVYVKGTVTLEDYPDAPVFPSSALRNDKEILYVFVVNGTTAHRVNVTLIAQEGEMSLTKEIKAGDEVVIVGQDNLKEGSTVAIRNK